jgi:hypothetical protein
MRFYVSKAKLLVFFPKDDGHDLHMQEVLGSPGNRVTLSTQDIRWERHSLFALMALTVENRILCDAVAPIPG